MEAYALESFNTALPCCQQCWCRRCRQRVPFRGRWPLQRHSKSLAHELSIQQAAARQSLQAANAESGHGGALALLTASSQAVQRHATRYWLGQGRVAQEQAAINFKDARQCAASDCECAARISCMSNNMPHQVRYHGMGTRPRCAHVVQTQVARGTRRSMLTMQQSTAAVACLPEWHTGICLDNCITPRPAQATEVLDSFTYLLCYR